MMRALARTFLPGLLISLALWAFVVLTLTGLAGMQ